MLTPPTPKADEAPKRSEAVFVADRLVQNPTTDWTREITFFFEGDDYPYSLVAFHARTEEEARRVLYSPQPKKELQSAFLRDVRLDMTRPH